MAVWWLVLAGLRVVTVPPEGQDVIVTVDDEEEILVEVEVIELP